MKRVTSWSGHGHNNVEKLSIAALEAISKKFNCVAGIESKYSAPKFPAIKSLNPISGSNKAKLHGRLLTMSPDSKVNTFECKIFNKSLFLANLGILYNYTN